MTAELDVRAPLFDRLVDLEPESRSEVHPRRTLDRDGLRESVRRELQRLLSTNCPLPGSELSGRQRTVIDYGIPDFATFAPRSHGDRVRLAAHVRRAIEAFEPRLRQVRVILELSEDAHLALVGHIEGVLIVERVAQAVSFPTVFSSDTGEVEVHASP